MDEQKRSLSELHKIQKQLSNEVSSLKESLEAEKTAKNTEAGMSVNGYREYYLIEPLAARRRAQQQLQELQISTAASTSRHGGRSVSLGCIQSLNVFRRFEYSDRELQIQG